MKTLDDAVIELSGVLPDYYQYNTHEKYALHASHGLCSIDEHDNTKLDFICRAHEFKQRAKELGFVGKYRWGVEYENKGDEPPISDDVLIETYSTADERWNAGPCSIWNFKARTITAFKITDPRFKPADTSYLDKPEVVCGGKSSVDGGRADALDSDADWYDYDNQKALRLPPVGVQVIGFIGTGFKLLNLFYVGKNSRGSLVVEDESGEFKCFHEHQINFKPLDHDRKAKAERKRVVDAVMKELPAANELILCDMYDKGFLRMPEKSQ